MKQNQFDILLKRRLSLIESVLGSKGKEYTRDDDRLSNFKDAARVDDETPEQALWGMFKKHLISVKDIKNDIAKGKLPNFALLEEKIGDSINYFILLEVMIKERIIKEFQEKHDQLTEEEPHATECSCKSCAKHKYN
jgi:hypothetical protein